MRVICGAIWQSYNCLISLDTASRVAFCTLSCQAAEGKVVSLRERSEAASSAVSIRRMTSGVGDTSRSRLGDEFAILSRSRQGS